jgi:hypothetical protein
MNLLTNYLPPYLLAADRGNISTLAASSARTALDATDKFWAGMYNGSGIFGELSKFCMAIAFLFLMWKIYQLYEEYREHTDYTKIINSLLLPIVIFCLLHNSGAMAKGFTRQLRVLTSDFGIEMVSRSGNDGFLDSTKANMPPSMKSNQIFKDLTVKLDKCRTADKPDICATLAASTMIQDLNKMNPPPDPITKNYALDLQKKIVEQMKSNNGAANAGINLDSVMNLFTNGIPSLGDIGEQIVITLLNAVVICFYWAMELATLIAFYLFPVALAMGVIDKKALVDWFTSYWGICNAKICFAIVLAMIGEVGNAMQGASFVVELLGAIFAPTVAFMMAKGSAVALAEGFQGAAMGAAMGAAKGAGGMAGKGVERHKDSRKAAKAEKATQTAQKAQATQNSRILKALAIGRRG